SGRRRGIRAARKTRAVPYPSPADRKSRLSSSEPWEGSEPPAMGCGGGAAFALRAQRRAEERGERGGRHLGQLDQVRLGREQELAAPAVERLGGERGQRHETAGERARHGPEVVDQEA